MKSIREFSKMLGVYVRTLQYYDQIGLLEPVYRNSNGYRYYDLSSYQRMQDILAFKSVGFSLKKIQELLDVSVQEKQSRLARHIDQLKAEQAAIEDQIRQAKCLSQRLADRQSLNKFSYEEETHMSTISKEKWGNTMPYKHYSIQFKQESNYEEEMQSIFEKIGAQKDQEIDDDAV